MKKMFLLLGFVFLSGCGTVGYTISKRTGDDHFKGEVYWKIVEINLNRLWLKEVDSNGKETKIEYR